MHDGSAFAKMKVFLFTVLASSVTAFAPSVPNTRSATALGFDLDYGMKNDYVPASGADGGQGQFGARSPNDWRVAGTSPVGETSYSGAADGGEEPWFAEAVSTVSLDLEKADETLKAFTKDAASFKIAEFGSKNPYGYTSDEEAMEELVGKLGYSKFLEMSSKQLLKTWKQLHPEPEKE